MLNISHQNPVILASRSPRRKILFSYIGIPYEILASEIEERQLENEKPESHVIRLSCLKAMDVHDKIPKRIIVGVDTIVELNGKIMGKPSNKIEAQDMLNQLSGQTHRVFTGVSVAGINSENCISGCEVSYVKFRKLGLTEIEWYLNTGEYIGKAGSYGIQGKGLKLIEHWTGSFSNIVGLPLRLTQNLLFSEYGNENV
ncbi:MAG: septum formation protein Maf [Candidatus Schekmanbacteria bacterium RBG_13_48_7]|uniref:dTTP/UTP pyrophosphatase n=1 Tax=Candidatus Schekmanbacteria bacterium RBG_13_48_7 TaxID=1817878 RepID=A0A1F7S077_9BACT|nr:MAG: septum formation protein Maf [Candidatus Schekmanbacteria bacterium RBG_13_48_7]